MVRKKLKYSYRRRKAIDMGTKAKRTRKKGVRISTGDRKGKRF